jgi:hypothetical protein
MPITIQPFVQYQAPLFPLRGLWNTPPAEGDRMVAAEIDWGVTVPIGRAVQFALSGNSPVAISQIVALQVDNTSNAVDLQFQFPDSGYVLNVPAYAQGVFPVFTNALMFYVSAPGAVVGDRTLFQVFNSMPPPIAVQVSEQQEYSAVAGVSLSANAITQLIPAGVSGTIETIAGNINVAAAIVGNADIHLIQGDGTLLWISNAAADMAGAFQVGPVRIGFVNGVRVQTLNATITAGSLLLNLYYAVP